MNAAAAKEFAQIAVNTALATVAKKWKVTERQALDQIQSDAINGTQSGLTKAFAELLAEARKFLESGRAQDFLKLA